MKYKKVIQLLLEEHHRLGGIIFGESQRRVLAEKSDDLKKAIQTEDMMSFLLGKGNYKQEWKMKEMEEYKDMMEITEVINLLSTKLQK